MIRFLPLALTQALPFLPLARGDIDYNVDARSDPATIPRILSQSNTRVILVRDGKLAVPAGQGELVEYESARMRLATLPVEYVSEAIREAPQVNAIYLGAYHEPTHQDVLALDLSELAAGEAPDSCAVSEIPNSLHEGADDAFEHADLDVDAAAQQEGSDTDKNTGESTDKSTVKNTDKNTGESTVKNTDKMGGRGADGNGSATATSQSNAALLVQAVRRFDWVDLRGFAPHASAREVGEATSASSLSVWHSRQRHCPACGTRVVPALSGWAQQCTSKHDGQRILFPRIEPAVITSIVDGRNRILLQHNRAWSDPRLYSVSAGFVEAGENLEHACRREAKEETGLTLGEVTYLGSQPWPFPASLMVAFKAHALSTEVHVDGRETSAARWFTHDEYLHAVLAGEIVPPSRAAIAHGMIQEWFGSDLPDVS